MTDFACRETTFICDGNDRLWKVNLPHPDGGNDPGPTAEIEYDAQGRIAKVEEKKVQPPRIVRIAN